MRLQLQYGQVLKGTVVAFPLDIPMSFLAAGNAALVSLWEGAVPRLLGGQLLGAVQLCR